MFSSFQLQVCILFALMGILTKTQTGCEGAAILKHVIHTNLCSYIDPEPKVHLSNMLNTNDIFFPSSYTERKCSMSQSTKSTVNPISWPTCLNGQYHCVTRYKTMKFLRFPRSPGNKTLTSAKVQEVQVPVACVCSSFTYI